MNYNLQKLKLFLLQKKYSDICNIIVKLQEHINLLYKTNFIEYNERMTIFNELFDITKILNSKYNDYINKEVEIPKSDDVSDSKSEILVSLGSDSSESNNKSSEQINDNQVFSNLLELNNFLLNNREDYDKLENNLKIFPVNDPLSEYTEKIRNMIKTYGLGSVSDSLVNYFGKQKSIMLNVDNFNLFSELEDIILCIGIDEINSEQISLNKKLNSELLSKTTKNYQQIYSKLEKEYYFLDFPNKFSDNDYLARTRILYLLNDKKIIRLKVIFKNDYLSINLKSSQINLPILYKKKNNIINLAKEKKIDTKFVKSFIRYDYIGNIYSMSDLSYIKFIEESYTKFIKIINQSILNLMKEFLSKTSKLKDMYEIIFLLLLGDDENYDIAGILLGLLKEKKNQVKNIYNLIYDNLSFYLQGKVKKSSLSIKEQTEKLKKINIDNVDFSKQLITNKSIPDNVKSLAMEKIEEMKSFNNEYFKQLTFVKHIINFPWPSSSEDHFYQSLKMDDKKSQEYVKNVEKKLKDSSYGHEEAKKSLLQVIGKWISNPGSQGTSFGLVGPPGVGKTLLAKSVSKSLDIPFAQITLGGQNDGEILHGHGYTYSGSQPGMIIKKMVEMCKSRCILYFDELDKACSKHGQVNEITSILIHLTDPNMNKTFQDRFFQGIDFPLDKVIMMFSYNDSSLVDPILLDRLKEINVNPYSLKDKIEIVNNFIIPELINSIGLQDIKINITNDIIEYLIENYTQEAGVREIKRKIEEIFLHINLDKLYKRGTFIKNCKSIKLDKRFINKILKNNIENSNLIHDKSEIGIINGLYATNSGNGGIVPIQIFKNISLSNDPSSSQLVLTGSQGDTMKESVTCSLTCAKQFLERALKTPKFNKLFNNKIKDLEEYLVNNFKSGFHVHTPSTATPKDGPSAGCAFTCAFISRILNRPIKNTIAMTGEIELTGRITKIGGLIYKLNGAKKAGVKEVFICDQNKKDLDEIKEKNPKLIDKNFKVTIVNYIDDLIDKILD